MFDTLIVASFLCHYTYSAFKGVLQSQVLKCGDAATDQFHAVDLNGHVFQIDISPASTKIITFSTCNTQSNLNTGLRLYDYPSATEIGVCVTPVAPSCANSCANGYIYSEIWNTTLDQSDYYIEIYTYAPGIYTLDMDCIPDPSNSQTTTPTTNIPTTNTPTTFSPTTNNPTTEPTSVPSSNPSYNPSSNPSYNPSSNPSSNPSYNPTTEPTSVPTSNPSFNPTKITLYPTKIPTFNPILYKNGQSAETNMETTETPFSHTTNNPTMILIDQSNQNDTYDNSNIININNIPFIIVFILVIITIIAYMDATRFRVNDFFKLGALIIASMHLLDIIYDCLFAFKIAESEYAVLLLFCIAFIIIPMVVTLYQLHTDINKWKRSDVLSEWLSNNVTLLYMISSICGSAFTAVQLCTSNLFNLTQFDMPLSRIQFNKFQTKRVFSVVLLENIPQLAIQIVYLSISNANTNNIVFISMGFSVLSIIISIFSMVAQRNITRSRDYISIQYNVTGISIIGQTHKHRNKIKQIRNHISSILGINRELIEIQRPIEIPKGLEIHVNIYVNHTKAIDTNFEKVIHESQRSGELGEIMKNAWSLSSVPLINNIKYEKYESKERRDQTVMIQANKSFDIPNNVEIAMSKVMSHSDMSVEYGNEVQVLPPRIAPVTITVGEFGKDSDNESNTGEQSYNKETTKGNDATYKDDNVTAGINQNNDMDIVNEINETTTNGTRNDEPM